MAVVLKNSFRYEIAKAAGFVTTQDFIDGRFSLITRSYGQSAFSGCQICSVIRFQRQPWFSKTVFFTRLLGRPVLFLHEILLTACLIRLRDLMGSRFSVAVGSVLSCDFIDGRSWFS